MFWRGILGYLPMNVVQGLVGLASIVVFTRLLTPDEFGVYALAFSAMALGHTLVFSWMEAAMARFYAPEALAGREASLLATLYRCWLGAAAAFVGVGGAALLLWPGDGAVKLAIAVGMAATLARSLAKLNQERRRAVGDVRGAVLMDVAQTTAGFAFGVGLVILGLNGEGPIAGLGVAAAVVVAFVLPAELTRGKNGALDLRRAATYASYGLPVALSLIFALMLATTDRFMIAAWLNTASVGVYQSGYTLANRTLDVMFIWLGAAGEPALIVALERFGASGLAKAAREQAGLMLGLAVPATVGLALVAHPLAEVMIGPALQRGAAEVTPWIAVGSLFAGFTNCYAHQAFTLGRRTGLLLAAMAIPAAANVLLCLWLIPRYGVQGATWATAASYAIGFAASIVLGRFAHAMPFPGAAFAKAGAAAAVMGLAVAALPSPGGVLELALKAAVGAGVYALAAWAIDVAGLRSRWRDAFAVLRSRVAA